MPLNVKLALPLSIVVIAGFFYALQHIDPKTTSNLNPLATAKPRPEASAAARASGVRPTPANNRFTLTPSAPGLAARSPVERARDAAPKSNDTMVVRDTPPAGDPAERFDPPALLPPRSDLARGTPPPDIDASVGARPAGPITLIAQPMTEHATPAPAPVEVRPIVRGGARDAGAEPAVAPVPTGAKTYVVKTGDNLTKIARRELNSDAPDALRRMLDANPQLKGRADRILVGMTLNVPDDSPASPQARELNGNVVTTRTPDAASRPPKASALEKVTADAGTSGAKSRKTKDGKDVKAADATKDARRRGAPVKPVLANAKTGETAPNDATAKPPVADPKKTKAVSPSGPTNSTVAPPQDVKVVNANGAHTKQPADGKRSTKTGQVGLKKADRENLPPETPTPPTAASESHAAKPESTPSLKKLPANGKATDASKSSSPKNEKSSARTEKAGRVAEKPGARNNERDAKVSKRTDRPA